MQSVAEIRTMLTEWQEAHPKLTPKTRKPSRVAPKWVKNLDDLEAETGKSAPMAPTPGVLVRCKCECLQRVPPAHLERRCFVCHGHRGRVNV